MCRLLGVMCNNPDRLSCFLYTKKDIYKPDPETSFDGYGMGYYNDFRALIFKKPLNKQRLDKSCYDIARDVKSDTFLVHIRIAETGLYKIENTHPFRFRNFVFAHIGSIYNFSKIDTKLYFKLPDFLMRNIQGETDSELFFHLILAELFRAGDLDRQDIKGEALINAIVRSIRIIEDILGIDDYNRSSFTSIMSNGEYMIGIAGKEPLYMGRFDSIVDCQLCLKKTRGTDTDILAEQHKNFRAVTLVGGALEGLLDKEEVIPDKSIVIVGRDLSVKTFKI
ncbi:MAG: class II glutamine amidotransferase [Deltaproteobacteria bacterium]|nr:class II glutamine amidotransferase [Deltaproteobacteria bacterium]